MWKLPGRPGSGHGLIPPGHPGHVPVWEADRSLIAGDAFVTVRRLYKVVMQRNQRAAPLLDDGLAVGESVKRLTP